VEIHKLLPSIPKVLSKALDKHYKKIKENFIEGKYGPSELNGAKFSEVIIRILQWHTSTNHSYTPLGTRIRNFDQATKNFENKSNFPDSIRFHIPRTLNVLYTIRNKRGVGHVAGDVDSNHMDALFVVSACDWILAELVRIFHNISISEAQDIIESIITIKIPLVWDIEGRKRVLQKDMPYRDKVLVLLYSEYPNPIEVRSLFNWTEHSNISNFRRDVLKSLHEDKLVEYDKNKSEVHLSPVGKKKVEEEIINKVF
jgi:hypothetical protein